MTREIVLQLFADADREMAALSAEARAQDKHLRCGPGCAACCAYIVGTIKAEAELIADHVQAMPKAQRDQVIARLYGWERAWRTFAGNDRTGADLRKSTLWQHKNVACPMLDLKTNRCGIYPVRPISCRVHHALALPPNPEQPPCGCPMREAPEGCVTTARDVACGHPPTVWQMRNDLIPHWQFQLVRRLRSAEFGILPLQVLDTGRRRWRWPHPAKLVKLPVINNAKSA